MRFLHSCWTAAVFMRVSVRVGITAWMRVHERASSLRDTLQAANAGSFSSVLLKKKKKHRKNWNKARALGKRETKVTGMLGRRSASLHREPVGAQPVGQS